jgi:hypothetical protein
LRSLAWKSQREGEERKRRDTHRLQPLIGVAIAAELPVHWGWKSQSVSQIAASWGIAPLNGDADEGTDNGLSGGHWESEVRADGKPDRGACIIGSRRAFPKSLPLGVSPPSSQPHSVPSSSPVSGCWCTRVRWETLCDFQPQWTGSSAAMATPMRAPTMD